MIRNKKIFANWILLLMIGLGSCSVQQNTVEYSFNFLDKWGMVTGYELQYYPVSRTTLDDEQKKKLFLETEKTARAYGREIALTDFYFKRDSIEEHFIMEIIEQMEKNEIEIKDIKIINLIVNKQIADALSQRAAILNEPQPTRIKILD